MNVKKKSLTKFLTFATLIFSAIYISLSTAYNLTVSDAVYARTLLPIALTQIIIISELISYGVCFSLFVYSIYRIGVKKSLPLVFIYGGILLAEKLLDTNIGHLIFLTGWDLEGLLYVLLIWLLEMLLAFAVVLVAFLCLRNNSRKDVIFDKLYPKENALQRAALIISVIISLLDIIPRIIEDIMIGAPTDIIDVLWIAAMYLSHVASGVIVYIVSFFVMKKLCAAENI